ncbi:hypothetical protein E2C01_062355 [Portunus trituberculatus]|uniref:Uncharacterized protein n=1 Tax=Portunus trituberculatus TaxID=210409 RepID=A0A5B7HH32_PORTR|nr:hypothetical protein [Portunus trituberculatus]
MFAQDESSDAQRAADGRLSSAGAPSWKMGTFTAADWPGVPWSGSPLDVSSSSFCLTMFSQASSIPAP